MSAADDLRALSVAATPGPWETDRAPQNEMLTVQTLDGTGVVYDAIYDADAELIVWLRNHADALADLIDAAGALVQPAGWWTGVEQRQEHQLLDRRAVVRDALDALDADA